VEKHPLPHVGLFFVIELLLGWIFSTLSDRTLEEIKMKAIVYDNYGPPEVLQRQDVPKPTSKVGEISARIHAAAVTVGYWRIRKADPVVIRHYNCFISPRR
jgi:hypothetical protein